MYLQTLRIELMEDRRGLVLTGDGLTEDPTYEANLAHVELMTSARDAIFVKR